MLHLANLVTDIFRYWTWYNIDVTPSPICLTTLTNIFERTTNLVRQIGKFRQTDWAKYTIDGILGEFGNWFLSVLGSV